MQIQCRFQLVIGRSKVKLPFIQGKSKVQGRAKTVYFGNNCDFVRLALIPANPGCDNGDKFVLKRRPPVKKQFLILENEAVLYFVKKDNEFPDPQCGNYNDVTSKVRLL